MSKNDKPSFLDRGTILAFAVILLFWFGWTKWMDAKYPQSQVAATTAADNQAVPQVNNPSGAPVSKTDPAAPTAAKDAAVAGNTAPANETVTHFSQGPLEFDISSIGMGLKNIQLKDYTSRDGKTIQLAGAERDPAFATRVSPYDQPLNFTVEKKADDTFIGTASSGGATITKTLKVNPSTYSVETSIEVKGATPALKGISTRLVDEMTEPAAKKGFFDVTPDFHTWFVLHDGSKARQPVKRTDANELLQPNVSVASLSVHYFALAVTDKSSIMPRFESRIPANATTATGQLIYEPSTMPETLTLNYTAFAGPKSFALLSEVDPSGNMTGVIDYGTFSIIAKPILWLLKQIHTFISNWGLAIIFLTIIVRLIVLPFNVYSYKSMKVMQKLQPQMNTVRERYKDKSAEEKLKMNAEIMALMKENKANPLGGCLPMLLQLPVFIALYQVLGQSIELYQAPFIFWIHDLSLRDPWFVLPILMGITMFIQQKITPSTMDPAQAKIMMWMPVIFSFFMISLPSGLTLYIFVSTLFGIIQQFVFLRDRKPASGALTAKAKGV
jgi:YidC/Oxa1 family membrane protein insertase